MNTELEKKLKSMSDGVTFEEEDHKYFYKGILVPSVTQIMRPLYDFSAIRADVLEHKASIGTQVHYAIEKFIRFGYESELDAECQPYFVQFMRFFNENGMKRENAICEVAGINKTYNFCGTMDMPYQDEDLGLSMWDFKTSATPDPVIWSVQLSAYAMIAKEYEMVFKYKKILHLMPDGYNVYDCNDNLGVFLHCLGIYQFLNK